MKTLDKSLFVEQTEIRLITPEDAAVILALVDHNKQKAIQRPISQRHVDFLASEMERGHFTSTATVHLMKCYGVSYLVNGQHTLNAIVKSGQAAELIYIYQVVLSERVVKDAYITYDNQRSRRESDTFKAMGVYDKTGLGDSDVKRLSSTLRYFVQWHTGKRTGRVSNHDLLIEVEKWLPVFEELKIESYGLGVYDNGVKGIWNRSTLWVLVFAYKEMPAKVIEFLSRVATGEMMTREDPRFRLFRFLADHRVGGGQHKGRDTASGWNFTQMTIYCWNKWLEGEEIRRLMLPKEKLTPTGVDVDAIYDDYSFKA